MTTTIQKSLSDDFGGDLATTQLRKEINDDGGIGADCLGVYSINSTVDIIFDSALSGGEQTTLDNIISAHVADASPPKEQFYTYHPRSNYTSSSRYQRLGGPFKYPGSDEIGIINYIEVNSYKTSSPTSYNVRIYDNTNKTVIAEKTGLTNTAEALNDLETISNIPTGMALFEIQAERVGGNGSGKNKRVYVEEVIIYYDN